MGVRSVAVFKLQMSFCTCGVSQHDRVIADPRLGQGENVLNNIKRIERGEQNIKTSFRILLHENNSETPITAVVGTGKALLNVQGTA